MSSPNNMWDGYSPYIAQASKDAVLTSLRAAYPKATNFITWETARHMVRGSPGFDMDSPDGRDKAYVCVNWSKF
jgi:hypothetical protein